MSIATLLRVGPWLAILLLTGLLAVQNDRVKSWKQTAELCAQGREADRETYEAAQAKAKADNIAHVREVESEQKARTDAIQSRWNTDRARLAELLRRSRTPAPEGSADATGAPEVPGTAEGSDGSGEVCIPEGDALSAAENELRLFYLQEWIREQLRIVR